LWGLRWLCGVREYGCEDHALTGFLGVVGYAGVEIIRSGFSMVGGVVLGNWALSREIFPSAS
jgi:hypothetical protein